MGHSFTTHSLDPPLGQANVCQCLVTVAVASNLSVVSSEVLESLVCDSSLPAQVVNGSSPPVSACCPVQVCGWVCGVGLAACADTCSNQWLLHCVILSCSGWSTVISQSIVLAQKPE